jgi:DNA-binding beta-propeller fold protein YncE
VTNYESVSEINLTTFTVSNTISVVSNAYVVAINPAGTFAYVVNSNGTISKIRLATETFADITVGSLPTRLAFNTAGTFAYVTNYNSNTVSKIVLTATDPQSITFQTISTQLSGTKTMALSATASSPLPVTFTSATPTVCSVSGSMVTIAAIGDCSINANQSGGSGWDAAPQVTQTFTILPSPPVGEAGVSIKNGDPYSNTKQVTLNLIWPEYATSARISNDGGFAVSKTQTKDLAASIDWELDDSIKGIYPKVVYVRFNGVVNTTQTYSDDIILDTSPPVVESSSAAAVSGSIDLTLKATDDITGVDKVQIKNGATTVTKDYAAKVSVPLADLLLSVSSMGVQKLAATSVEIRVSDKAGNWSAYMPLSVSSVATAPTVTKSKSATAKSIAIFAKIPVLSTSKVSLKVVSGYAKFCKVSGTTLKGIKAGTCKVTVTVTPKKGKAIPKTVTLKVTN